MCLGQVNQPTSEIHCDSGDGTERIHSFQICLQKGKDDGLQSQKKLETFSPQRTQGMHLCKDRSCGRKIKIPF